MKDIFSCLMEKNAMESYQLCLVVAAAAGITFLAIVLSSIIKYA